MVHSDPVILVTVYRQHEMYVSCILVPQMVSEKQKTKNETKTDTYI